VNFYIDNDVECLVELGRFLPFVGYIGDNIDFNSKISFQSQNLTDLLKIVKV
jgi:hypothetical protein